MLFSAAKRRGCLALFLIFVGLSGYGNAASAEDKITGNNYVDLTFNDLIDNSFLGSVKDKLKITAITTIIPQCKLEETQRASCSYSFSSVHSANFFYIKIVKTAPLESDDASYLASAYFESESTRSLYGNVPDTSGQKAKGYSKIKVRNRQDGYFGIIGLKDNFVVEVFAAGALGEDYPYEIVNSIAKRISEQWTLKTSNKKPDEVVSPINFDYGKSYGVNKAVVSTFNGGTTGQVEVTISKELLLEKILLKRADLTKPLQGKILLKTGDKGRAYYVHYRDMTAFYLGRPHNAFSVMKEQGVGIKNADLARIPIAYSQTSGEDSDGDGLSDLLENAIGTDKSKKDTDNDGFDDKKEILSGYDPRSKNMKAKIDQIYADKQKGKILLQVEGNGEAWYINPSDGKRYFLGRPADAFNIMRKLALGISNENFDKLWK